MKRFYHLLIVVLLACPVCFDQRRTERVIVFSFLIVELERLHYLIITI